MDRKRQLRAMIWMLKYVQKDLIELGLHDIATQLDGISVEIASELTRRDRSEGPVSYRN